MYVSFDFMALRYMDLPKSDIRCDYELKVKVKTCTSQGHLEKIVMVSTYMNLLSPRIFDMLHTI